MSIHVIVGFQAQSEQLSRFERLLRDVAVQLPRVTGCEEVRVLRDTADATRFTLIERWSSRSLHEAHLARVVSSGGWDALRSHLAGEPSSGYFAELPAEITP